MQPFNCKSCDYSSKYKFNLKRHENSLHINRPVSSSSNRDVINMVTKTKKKPVIVPSNEGFNPSKLGSFDVRLKKNFKLFISGPSGSGKTFFIKDLLNNLDIFANDPPKLIIYVYRVWQPKYEEMGVDIFIEDGSNLLDKINYHSKDHNALVVFDDLINSESTPSIARLFTVDGRHSNMSLIFVTQKMFVNDDKFREISGNSDYFLVFKNPRNAREIRTLASQMTPGKMDLVNYYVKATEKPYSYLLINLTQQCPDQVKFLSHLFNAAHVVRVYYDSSYLSLHDNQKGKRTNFSKMFLTNEIVEECNCTCQDEIHEGPSLFENKELQLLNLNTLDNVDDDKNSLVDLPKESPVDSHEESADILDQSFDQEMKNVKNASDNFSKENPASIEREQKVEPLILKRSLEVKTVTPEKVVLRNNYEVSPKKDEGQKKTMRYEPYNEGRAKTRQENLKNVNKFGGSYSSEVWNQLNEIEKEKQKEHKIVDKDDSIQADISKDDKPSSKDENRSQNISDEKKELEFQLYDDLQCPNCEEVFKNKVAIKNHESSCKVTAYACTECGVNFASRNGLKSHITLMHEERPKLLMDKKKVLADKNRN